MRVGLVAPPKLVKSLYVPIKEVLGKQDQSKILEDRYLNLTAFNSTEAFFHAIKSDPDNNFCFGFEMSSIYPGVKEVNFTLLMP